MPRQEIAQGKQSELIVRHHLTCGANPTMKTNAQALIVEDNAINSEILETMLARSGIQSIVIRSPELISATAKMMPELKVMFLDIEFPNANGFSVIQQLRATDWDQSVPIVAYTVHISEVDRARRSGFHSFLGKPVDPFRFPEQIKSILAGKPVWSIP